MKHRTRAYWPTRILLAIGFVAVLLPLAIRTASSSFFPANDAILLVGFVFALVGFAWMLLILRGPSDEPPAWRYRDH
jgi:hypothetical protein